MNDTTAQATTESSSSSPQEAQTQDSMQPPNAADANAADANAADANAAEGNAAEGSSPAAHDEENGNREAARYRRQLRETEAQRNTLSERVERMQRSEVERLAAQTLAVAADVWAVGGLDLATVLNEHGDIDPDAVDRFTDEMIRARPGLHHDAKRRPFPDMGQGQRAAPLQASSWGAVISGS